MVASINQTLHEGDDVKRGDEIGYFAFGGSTIVVVFPPDTVVWDPDLVENSKNAVRPHSFVFILFLFANSNILRTPTDVSLCFCTDRDARSCEDSYR